MAAGLVKLAALGVHPGEREPVRLPGRAALGPVRDDVLDAHRDGVDVCDPTLDEQAQELVLGEEHVRVCVSGLPAELVGAAGQVHALGDASFEQGERRAPEWHIPRVCGQARVRGDGCVGVDLVAHAGPVADLEQVDDAPVARLQRKLVVVGVSCEVEHFARQLEAALGVLGAPQRDVAGIERSGQRRGIAVAPGENERLIAGRLAAGRVGSVGQLDREPCQQSRAQRRVVGAERVERLLELSDDLGVGSEDCHARAAGAERGPREEVGAAGGARERACFRERCLRVLV